MSPLERLEQYTTKRRQEVLVVTARVNGVMDEILVFKGFSSSLMKPTAFDPDVAVLPEGAEIVAIAASRLRIIPSIRNTWIKR